MYEDKKWYESSTGNNTLSLTIKGAMISFVPVAVALLHSHGIAIADDQVTGFINQTFMFASALVVFIGVCRKAYFWFRGNIY